MKKMHNHYYILKGVKTYLTGLFLVFFLIFGVNSFAGIDNLVKFVSPEGSMSNVNSPAIIKDQRGGYMTGGSILLRGPSPKELQPLQIQTPRLKFDACTGSADFRFGALSYISHEEFTRFLKSVGHASGAYMVKMLIKTSCPQCEDIMTYLETVARDMNNITMNQCAMAQSLTKGVIGKIASSEKQRCMMESAAFNESSDLFATTSKCADSIEEKSGKSDHEELKSLLGDEFNLVWKALNMQGTSDSNFKELMMSVSGTIIGKKEGGKYKFIYKASLLQDKDLLEKYIGTSNESSKIKLYSCNGDNKKCMDPIEIEERLAPHETLYGNISKIFSKLVERVKNDDPNLTDEERALVSFSSIPILKLIEIELASKARTEDLIVRVPEFVEVICYDVITQYMQKMLDRVLSNVKNLEHAQIDDMVIRNFVDDAEKVRNFLKDAKYGAFKKLQIIMQVKEQMALQEKAFQHSFGNVMKDIEL